MLPFRILVDRIAGWEIVAYGGFATGALLLAGGLVAGARSRLVSATTLAGVGAAAFVMAFSVAAFSSQMLPAEPDGAPPRALADPADGSPVLGRPYVQSKTSTVPARPRAGEPVTLRIGLVDGSTGRPVDDLVAHHAALAHLVVTSEDGAYFRHLHPIRPGPGRLEVRLEPDRPGRYVAYVELERADSGSQLVRAEFVVAGAPASSAPTMPDVAAGGAVGSSLAAARASTSPEQPVAGRPTTIELDTGHTDLQPWLGMAGHLIVRDTTGEFFGHVHETTSMSVLPVGVQAPDETVAAYGPTLRFTFNFPRPGRYRAWVQYARDFRVVTVPLTVTVAAEGNTP